MERVTVIRRHSHPWSSTPAAPPHIFHRCSGSLCRRGAVSESRTQWPHFRQHRTERRPGRRASSDSELRRRSEVQILAGTGRAWHERDDKGGAWATVRGRSFITTTVREQHPTGRSHHKGAIMIGLVRAGSSIIQPQAGRASGVKLFLCAYGNGRRDSYQQNILCEYPSRWFRRPSPWPGAEVVTALGHAALLIIATVTGARRRSRQSRARAII